MLLLLALAACGPDVSISKVAVDADHDGYDRDVDCDDARSDVNPTADEVCDGVDNDCDTSVDEDATDATTFYTDADADGFGDADAPRLACEAPEGATDDATDCDDADSAVSPEADERCNGADDDCDGETDEDSVDVTTAYDDADGDGYGDASVAMTACEHPGGYVADATDCDDMDAAVNPGAEESDCTDPTDYNCDGSTGYADLDTDGWAACEDCDDADSGRSPGLSEVCDGAVDEDCDALVDDEDPDVTDPSTWYGDADGDGWGEGTVTTAACAAPSGFVAVDGDCDDGDAARSPGLMEVCDPADADEDCSGAADDADAGTDTSTFTTYAEDADADGYGDGSRTIDRCDAPAGYAADATDCDDTDADVHPGADEPDCTDPVDYDCDGAVAYADVDADGSAACEDCDDADAARSPDNIEVCDGVVDEDCDTLVDDDDPDVTDLAEWYRDADGDAWGNTALTTEACAEPSGFAAVPGDCDDHDPGRSPGLTEVCDAADLDEDCSGAADDADAGTDASTFATYARDADEDGYGDPTRTVTTCDAPDGYGVDATDCDDSDAEVNPDAAEVCDGDDDDCDTLVDDADPGVSGGSTWYQDADGDTHGGALTTAACDAPAGYVATSTDCDDTSAAISPAAAEVCDAADVDEDCDGAADDADASATGMTPAYADSDSDGFGDPATRSDACDAPVGTVNDDTDCDDTDGAVNTDAVETCNDYDDDCDGLVDDEDSLVTGTTTWYADADGDTFGDASVWTETCDPPAGTVADDTDCDDTDDGVSPDEREVCGDGVDQDCDGADGCESPCDSPTATVDAGLDAYGDAEVSYFCAGESLPSGIYQVTYDSGAINYSTSLNPSGGWCVNRDTLCGNCDGTEPYSDIGVWVVYDAGSSEVAAPGDSSDRASQAAVEAASAGAYIQFEHAGGTIGVEFHDWYYADNADGAPNPSFELALVE